MLCGIDEAGRGCVAGSLFMSAVVLNENLVESFKLLNPQDSKKLSYKNRNLLATKVIDFLESRGGFFKTISFSASEIDSKGLAKCLKNGLENLRDFAIKLDCETGLDFEMFSGGAFHQGVFHRGDKRAKILFDGNTNFGVSGVQTLVKGDGKDALISAASILAKCAKDAEMLELDRIYPQYNFKNNKGYLTPSHIQSLRMHGYTAVHRRSYKIRI